MPKRTLPGDLPAPMLAKVQPEMPVGDGWTYEPKWDGFRAIVAVDRDGQATLSSRDGRALGRYFPELIERLGSISADGHEPFVVDAEIVRIAPGRMDFDELQLRLHPAESRVRRLAGEIPATLVVFDLLRVGDDDLTVRPLGERLERLTSLASTKGWAPAPGDLDGVGTDPSVLVGPSTEDPQVARAWFDDDAGIGQDGIIAKRIDQPYLSGERGWIKVKHRTTLDCVVGGYRLSKTGATSEPSIGALLLGLYDGETLHYVGHTSSFKAKERRDMLEVLRPLEGGESFEGGRAPGGQSRWSAGKEAAWITLQPVLVCEVTIDRVQKGRFRHAATFVRWRDDREPLSCTFDQVPG
ncbi:MAG TPA: ATP-dependent DNA ligase, partial [Actinomycetota bacterium]